MHSSTVARSALLVRDGLDDTALIDAAGVRDLAQMGGPDAREQRLGEPRLVLLSHHELTCTHVMA